MPGSLEILPLQGIPEIQPGADLATLLAQALLGVAAQGDLLVVTHKIVSKAEGQIVDLASIDPGPWARQWARQWNKDPRQIEVVLRESSAILRMESGVIIARTRHGLTCANAGVDRSNSPGDRVILLPLDPDQSARNLSQFCSEQLGFLLPVLISDSFGRPWRQGIVNVAIGLAGLEPFEDYRGQQDPHGYPLEASLMASADSLCAAAELVMGKVDGIPAAIIRGYEWKPRPQARASDLLRPAGQDFFR